MMVAFRFSVRVVEPLPSYFELVLAFKRLLKSIQFFIPVMLVSSPSKLGMPAESAVVLTVSVVAFLLALDVSVITTVTVSPLTRALKSSTRPPEEPCQREPPA